MYADRRIAAVALKDHVIADSDLHVMEPPDLWQRYIAPEYAHAAPDRAHRAHARHAGAGEEPHAAAPRARCARSSVDGRKTGWREEHESRLRRRPRRAGWDAASQIDAMDVEGLDLAVLFPSRGLFVLGLDSVEQIGADGLEPAFATAIARAYNDWMADFCKDVARPHVRRRRWSRPHDIDGAVLEARRCVEELGFKAVFLAPGCVNRRPWHHPAYDPLWAEIAAARRADHLPRRRPDLPHARLLARRARQADDVAHVQPAARHPVRDGEPVRRRRARALPRTCGSACSRATARGRRGCSHRLDEHYEWTGWYEAHRPHDEAVGVLPAPVLPRRRGRGGDRASTTSTGSATTTSCSRTDYPHGDSQYPHAVDTFDKLPFPEASKAKICGENWERLYKIPLVKKTLS